MFTQKVEIQKVFKFFVTYFLVLGHTEIFVRGICIADGHILCQLYYVRIYRLIVLITDKYILH